MAIKREDGHLNDLEQRIIPMWVRGESATYMGQQLNCSRNVVAGVLTRLKKRSLLPKRAVVPKLTATQRKAKDRQEKREFEKQLAERRALEKKMSKAAIANLPPITMNPVKIREDHIAADRARRGVSFMRLQPHHCRWPLPDRVAAGTMFCGDARDTDSRSYCKEHHLRAYLQGTYVKEPTATRSDSMRRQLLTS